MIPAIAAALARTGGAAKAARIPTLTGWQSGAKPPPIPGSQDQLNLTMMRRKQAQIAAESKSQEQVSRAYEQNIKKTQSMGESLKSLNQDFVQASAGAYIAKSAVEGIFGTVAGQATIAASALKSMADPLLALTGLSNPASVKQFTLAFNDAMAVMGRVAMPVVTSLTKAMRIVGDTYARAEPFLLRVTQAVGAGINQVFGELEKVWKNNGPMIDMMTTAFTKFISVGVQVATVFIRIVGTFTQIISAVGKFLGFRTYKDVGSANKSAFGSAVRSVNIGASGEDVAKKAQETAFMQALQPPGGKAATEVDILQGIGTSLMEMRDKILEKIEKMPEAIRKELEALADKVIDALPGKQTANAIGSGARSAADSGLLGLPGMIASSLIR